MCGIVGHISSNISNLHEDLLFSLQRLEYRGYDSVGVATSAGSVYKGVGKVSELINTTPNENFHCGIGHCRWATHGGKTTANAHPHSNENGTIFAVHNGIIENYETIKANLENAGYQFVSDTDTEVIPHYFDWLGKQGMTTEKIIQQFFNDIKGTYAVLLFYKDRNKIYAFKKDSPLVLGVGTDFNIVASDIYAFCNKTTSAIFFDDMEYAVIDAYGHRFYDQHGLYIVKHAVQVEGEVESSQGDYSHYMIKEINEQPVVSRRLLRSMQLDQREDMEEFADYVDQAYKIVFVACGTSYHASLVAGAVLSRMGYNVHNIIASEFDSFYHVDADTLVVAISQSGETMDVVTVLKEAKKHGAKIAALTNVPYSTIERLSDTSLNILAGQEVAVASTKAFTNQVLALLSVAAYLDGNGMSDKIQNIPLRIEETIASCTDIAKDFAKSFAGYHHMFVLGRGPSYPISREIALKMKEITYIHAEGLMAAELKHGSIALIDPNVGTPVIILAPDNDPHMLSSAREVEARGAWTITLTNTDDGDIKLPSGDPIEFAIYASVVGQLLSYYTALELKRDIDQPRNLAKSVTVQ